MNLNNVKLAGNLTRDIELRYTNSGKALAKFGIAINDKWKGADGAAREKTTFVDVTAWGKQAEVLAQYLGKGSPLYLEGRLEYSTWDAADGKKRSKLDVTLTSFQFLGGGKRDDKSAPVQNNKGTDDIPF